VAVRAGVLEPDSAQLGDSVLMWAEMDVDGNYALSLWAFVGRRENVWAVDATTYARETSWGRPYPIPQNWHVICMGSHD
jgi:hypothetical protein